jgi:hypothetical protein
MIIDPQDVLLDFVERHGIREGVNDAVRSFRVLHGDVDVMIYTPDWVHGTLKALYADMPDHRCRNGVLMMGMLILPNSANPDLDATPPEDVRRFGFYARKLPEKWAEWVRNGTKGPLGTPEPSTSEMWRAFEAAGYTRYSTGFQRNLDDLSITVIFSAHPARWTFLAVRLHVPSSESSSAGVTVLDADVDGLIGEYELRLMRALDLLESR